MCIHPRTSPPPFLAFAYLLPTSGEYIIYNACNILGYIPGNTGTIIGIARIILFGKLLLADPKASTNPDERMRNENIKIFSAFHVMRGITEIFVSFPWLLIADIVGTIYLADTIYLHPWHENADWKHPQIDCF